MSASSTSRGPRAVPDLILEQTALGERDGAALGIATDDPRVQALRASSEEILRAHPARNVAAVVKARAAQHARPIARSPALWLAPAVAAAVVVLVVGLGRRTDESVATDEDTDLLDDVTTAKGLAPALTIAVQRGAGPAKHLDETDGTAGAPPRARPGEQIQLGVIAAGRTHAVVVSIDGRGGVTRHHPAADAADTRLPATSNAEVLLPHSFELDDAPAFERFFLVTSKTDAPLDVAAVLGAARALAKDPAARTGPLALGAGLEQSSRLLLKDVKEAP